MEHCGQCDRYFSTWIGLQQHYDQSEGHLYCRYCDEHFDNDEDFIEHGEDNHWVCGGCVKVNNPISMVLSVSDFYLLSEIRYFLLRDVFIDIIQTTIIGVRHVIVFSGIRAIWITI